jgi:hypothetical protein
MHAPHAQLLFDLLSKVTVAGVRHIRTANCHLEVQRNTSHDISQYVLYWFVLSQHQ